MVFNDHRFWRGCWKVRRGIVLKEGKDIERRKCEEGKGVMDVKERRIKRKVEKGS